MSSTILRWSAVPLGLLGFALRVAVTFWVQPLTWPLGFGAGLLVMSAALVPAFVLPFGIFALLGGYRRRPASFGLSQAGFVVPARAGVGGSQAIMWMCLSGGLVMGGRDPETDSMRLVPNGFSLWVSLCMVGVFWSVAAAFVLKARPQLHLDPDGLTIRDRRRGKRILWNDLTSGGPLPPTKRSPRYLKVYRNAPPVFGGFRPSEDIPVRRLQIDPAFLAAAIRHYVDHGEDRAAIGTGEEISRLRTAFVAPSPL